MTLAFLLTSLLIVASPGSGVIYTLAASLSGGIRAGIAAAIGGTVGILPHLLAAVFGLAAIFNTSVMAFQSVKWAGVLYLLWMAWQTLRAEGAVAIGSDAPVLPPVQVLMRAIVIAILNPKLSIFFFAFLPQFVSVDDPHPLIRMAFLGLAFMAMTLPVFIGYALLAARARTFVLERPPVLAWIRRGIAAGFVGVGLRLALTGR